MRPSLGCKQRLRMRYDEDHLAIGQIYWSEDVFIHFAFNRPVEGRQLITSVAERLRTREEDRLAVGQLRPRNHLFSNASLCHPFVVGSKGKSYSVGQGEGFRGVVHRADIYLLLNAARVSVGSRESSGVPVSSFQR